MSKEDYSKYKCPYEHVEKECGHELHGPDGYESTYGVWCACGFRGPVFCVEPEALRLELKQPEPKSWCNFELQPKNSWVHWMNGDAIVLKDISRNEYKFLEPCLSLPGRWVIDPDNPLKDKPEGLRDDAIIAYWVADTYDDALQVAEIGNWKYITAFTILEP